MSNSPLGDPAAVTETLWVSFAPSDSCQMKRGMLGEERESAEAHPVEDRDSDQQEG